MKPNTVLSEGNCPKCGQPLDIGGNCPLCTLPELDPDKIADAMAKMQAAAGKRDAEAKRLAELETENDELRRENDVYRNAVMCDPERGELIKELAKLQSELQDWRDAREVVINDLEIPDEQHCSCQPILKREIRDLRVKLDFCKLAHKTSEKMLNEYIDKCSCAESEVRDLRVKLAEAEKMLTQANRLREEAENRLQLVNLVLNSYSGYPAVQIDKITALLTEGGYRLKNRE